jgi:hypothetical protein
VKHVEVEMERYVGLPANGSCITPDGNFSTDDKRKYLSCRIFVLGLCSGMLVVFEHLLLQPIVHKMFKAVPG